MRKCFLVVLLFFVFTIPVLADDFDNSNPNNFLYRIKVKTYDNSGNLDNEKWLYLHGNNVVINYEIGNGYEIFTTDENLFYYLSVSGKNYSKGYTSSLSNIDVYGYIFELSDYQYNLSGDWSQTRSLNIVAGENFLGESVILPEEVKNLPVMMGQAAGLVISLVALPILITILGVLLIPRLVLYFRR